MRSEEMGLLSWIGLGGGGDNGGEGAKQSSELLDDKRAIVAKVRPPYRSCLGEAVGKARPKGGASQQHPHLAFPAASPQAGLR